MQFFVFVACLLASTATANPVEVHRRQLGGFGGPIGGLGVSQQSGSSDSSVSSHNSFGSSSSSPFGIGAVGGSSSFSAHSSSLFSSTNVWNAFNTCGGIINNLQGMLAAGTLTQVIAAQQMRTLAISMENALSMTSGCGGCFGQNGIVGSAGGIFNQFYSLAISMQAQFGSGFGPIMSPFGQIGNSFQSFFSSVQQSGFQISQFMPSGFPSLMTPFIPNFIGMCGFK